MKQVTKPCPVESAIQIIGGKWKLLVLRSILLNGPQRYNQLLTTVTDISPKELTRNLRELVEAGILSREVGERKIAHYMPTKLGEGLMPTFTSLLSWGQNLPAAS
ncbi:MAG: helix-turn-helix domain-containing protein [Terracidiphilus sp.]|jgi:DNA-binding HxlR family transcriptional regulator